MKVVTDTDQNREAPIAWLKEWTVDGEARRRVDLHADFDPWMLKYDPSVTPLIRAAERVRIIGWLRGQAEEHTRLAAELRDKNMDLAKAHKSIAHSYNWAADGIERGEHLANARNKEET